MGLALGTYAQERLPIGATGITYDAEGRDSIPNIGIRRLIVFKTPIDYVKYAKLIRNLKKVYPIALTAQQKLDTLEQQLIGITDKKKQQEFIKQVEKDLKKEYEPVLRKMTYSQGKILIKLIDRQTNRTSYEIVKQLRGSFSAFFWQGIARIFGANLKDRYEKEGEDAIIEKLIILYEAGLL